jgi:hypothetical protein
MQRFTGRVKASPEKLVPEACLYTSIEKDAQHGLNAEYSSLATWLCYTENKGNVYAIALEWPADNRLILTLTARTLRLRFRWLEEKGNCPGSMRTVKMVIDLNSVKISELPCEVGMGFQDC